MELELDFVRSLVKLMAEHNLQELDLEDGGQRIRLLRGQQGREASVAPLQTMVPTVMQPMSTVPMPVSSAPAGAGVGSAGVTAEAAKAELDEGIKVIVSPMVGTFYRAPSPDAEAFVEIGDSVGEESTLSIIEAMKVMNEIKAECSGEVVEILVANGEAVEYAQPLFHIRISAED